MKFLILLASVVVAISADCNPPDTNLHVYSDMTNPPLDIDLSSVTVSPYPPTTKQPIDFSFSYNLAGADLTDVKTDVSIKYYKNIWLLGCGWHSIPIPLNGLDACDILKNCPLVAGTNVKNTISLDLTPYDWIISTLPTNIYYEVKFTLKKTDGTPLNVLRVQMLAGN